MKTRVKELRTAAQNDAAAVGGSGSGFFADHYFH